MDQGNNPEITSLKKTAYRSEPSELIAEKLVTWKVAGGVNGATFSSAISFQLQRGCGKNFKMLNCIVSLFFPSPPL